MAVPVVSRTLALATDAGDPPVYAIRAAEWTQKRIKRLLMDNELPIATNRLHGLIEGFAGKRVLVIGDMVADEYLVGRPTRIARDAPVMILELYEERTVPGEAANVAVNARSLGAEVFLAGVVGNDVPGRRLRKAIEERGIHQDGLVSDDARDRK